MVWGVTQVDPLGLVQLLLHLEDVEVEVLLQLLVGEVDQQLLEAIVLEDLEAEDVEDANLRRRRRAARVGGERRVDPPHEPVEQLGVQKLRQRVT